MIIDAFLFYNEVKLLLYRLRCLWNDVDKFVIVDCTHTFSSKPYENFFNKNRALFEPYMSKIVHVTFKSNLHLNAWVNEIEQRNHILTVLDGMNLNPQDLVIFSDVDEIPNMKTVKNVTTIACINQIIYVYNIYQRTPDNWYKVFVTRWSERPRILCLHRVRTVADRNPINPTQNGGWHLSYFGNKDYIVNKLQSFAHQDLNTERIYNNIEPAIGRGESFISGQKYKKVEWDPANYPCIPGLSEEENRALLEDLSV